MSLTAAILFNDPALEGVSAPADRCDKTVDMFQGAVS